MRNHYTIFPSFAKCAKSACARAARKSFGGYRMESGPLPDVEAPDNLVTRRGSDGARGSEEVAVRWRRVSGVLGRTAERGAYGGVNRCA